jgi:hypothetical protein
MECARRRVVDATRRHAPLERIEGVLGVRFDKDNLPSDGWGEYRKDVVTRAVRIDGRFEVVTREGTLGCEDGWLALDLNGDPYPIAADVFSSIYVPL